MRELLEKQIAGVCQELFAVDVAVELTRPEEQFGDYATNVALQLAKQLGRPPREVAEALAVKLRESLGEQISENSVAGPVDGALAAESTGEALGPGFVGLVSEVTVAGPGFINLKLSDGALLAALEAKPAQTFKGQTVVAEYSDPNTFKALHAGHLYTTIVGNAIGDLLEVAGASVHRVNFSGDVGLHVAKAMWGIVRQGGGPELDEAKAQEFVTRQVASLPLSERATFMADRYVEGNTAYETDEAAKAQIVDFNQRVYTVHQTDDHDSDFARMYRTCRGWSYDYFKLFYEEIGVAAFEKYYPESETAPIGIATVKAHMQSGMYEESDGAVVFRGEPYGQHTRVFLNSRGLPTYEGKEVGLIMKKWADYHFDKSFIITGNDILGYMQVVQKSIEQFEPELVRRSEHRTHGQVKLVGGVKMSSRKGNVVYATDILEAAIQATQQVNDRAGAGTGAQMDIPAGKTDIQADTQTSTQAGTDTAYAAVKYAFLKQRLGGDIIYNPAESVALEGNSGPYVQYAHARARSIVRKAKGDAGIESAAEGGLSTKTLEGSGSGIALEPSERSLVRKIGEYTETVDKAVAELLPHHICTYLYELAQTFNRFYEHNRVIGDPREQLRLALVARYAETLKAGLGLLGIAAPEQM